MSEGYGLGGGSGVIYALLSRPFLVGCASSIAVLYTPHEQGSCSYRLAGVRPVSEKNEMAHPTNKGVIEWVTQVIRFAR